MRDLCDAFLLELQEKPYCKITIASICRRANIPRRSFYRYFHRKQDCLLAVVKEHLMESYQCAIEGGLHHFLVYWKEHQSFLRILKSNHLGAELLEQAVLLLEERNEPAWDSNQRQFVVVGMFCVTMQWVESGCKKNVDDLANKLKMILGMPLLELLA